MNKERKKKVVTKRLSLPINVYCTEGNYIHPHESVGNQIFSNLNEYLLSVANNPEYKEYFLGGNRIIVKVPNLGEFILYHLGNDKKWNPNSQDYIIDPKRKYRVKVLYRPCNNEHFLLDNDEFSK